MSTGIRELLVEYADGAKSYDVGRRAIAIGRRRRAANRLVPAAAAAVVLAACVTIVLVVRPGGRVVPPGPPAPTGSTAPIGSTAPTVKLTDYPPRIDPQDAPALPASGGVGYGIWLYGRTVGGHERTYLVVAGGAQYRVDTDATSADTLFTLSPDGRWLVAQQGTGGATNTRTTDLSDVGAWRETAGAPVAWSPNGRWLAVQAPRGAEPPPGDTMVSVLDMTDPGTAAPQIQVGRDEPARSVRDNGDLVLARFTSGTQLDLITVNHGSGQRSPGVHVDFGSELTGPERTTDNELVASLDLAASGLPLTFTADRKVLIQTWTTVESKFLPGDVLIVDAGTGAVVGRWQLPTPSSDPAGTLESWSLLQSRPDGLLLRHSTERGTVGIDRYDPATRQRTELTDLRPLLATGD